MMSGEKRVRLAAAMFSAAVANVIAIMLPGLLLRGSLVFQPHTIVFLGLATLFFLGDASSSWSSATDGTAKTQQDRRQFRLALFTGVLLWGTFAAGCVEGGRPPDLVLEICGGLLMLLGASLRFFAIRHLRSQFTSAVVVVAGNGQLVQSGIYRWLRHPSELGLLCAALGAALYFASVAAAIGACALLLATVLRIRWEDEQLALAWPEEFPAYRRRVPAILPFVL